MTLIKYISSLFQKLIVDVINIAKWFQERDITPQHKLVVLEDTKEEYKQR